MQKKPFEKRLAGPNFELHQPTTSISRATELYDILVRNDYFYPERLSFKSFKSPEDCMILFNKRLVEIRKGDSMYYDIVQEKDGGYVQVGEIYAKGIDRKNMAVNNIGYFVDIDKRGNGIAPGAVNLLTAKLFEMGFHRLCLYCEVSNHASKKVAEKSQFEYEGTKRDFVYDPYAKKFWTVDMYAKLAKGNNL